MRINIFLIAVLILSSNLQLFGQCERKKFCDDYMEDYDYRSQSSYAKLTPGDTASVNVVLYGGQKYRMFVCNDAKLGNVSWKIVQP